MSTTVPTQFYGVPQFSTHARHRWAERTPVATPDPIAKGWAESFPVDALVDGDAAFFNARYDVLFVVRGRTVTTILEADHDRMDTTGMIECGCGCLVDHVEHRSVCPRCSTPVESPRRIVLRSGGWL